MTDHQGPHPGVYLSSATALRPATVSQARGSDSQEAGLVSLVAPSAADRAAPLSSPEPVRQHYTHELHASRCVRYANERDADGVPLNDGVLQAYVQVKLGRQHGFQQVCGRIIRPWLTQDGFSMWKLTLAWPSGQTSEASVPAFMVRQCSGLDGFCACAGEAAGQRGPACGVLAEGRPGAL